MKHIIFVLLTACLLVGCSTTKHATTKYDSVDTVQVTKIEYMEKEIFRTVPDSASIQALLECDSIGQVRLKELLDYQSGKYIKPQIKVINNTVTLKAEVDSMAIYREYYTHYSKEDSLKSVIQSYESQVEKQNEANSFLNRVIWILVLVLILLAGGFGIFLYSKK